MAILIDPPRWPAHGTLWSHLVSDSNYEELHDFSALLPLPRRSFDLDHYDVPEVLYMRALELGATAVDGRDVVHRLRDSGLRVRHADRVAMRPVRRRQYLQAEWAALGASAGFARSARDTSTWQKLGEDLIARWNEPHRSYHDERHLEEVLLSLNHLATRGEQLAHETLLAAWFHDAVYRGTATDEQDSADLAVAWLREVGSAPDLAQRVGEIVVATKPGLSVAHESPALAHLLDADLAIFASSESRYLQYSTAVRAEYAHLPEPDFRAGRARILSEYVGKPTIYRTDTARQLWEARARTNLQREIDMLLTDAD
jgi:predicted metal-dependent HD superfamily phosphohydrolase